jgi:hypothetical protein
VLAHRVRHEQVGKGDSAEEGLESRLSAHSFILSKKSTMSLLLGEFYQWMFYAQLEGKDGVSKVMPIYDDLGSTEFAPCPDDR